MNDIHRRHRLTLVLDADSQEDLVRALENLALRIQMGEVTRGSWGSPSDGASYEYLYDPAVDHDSYFEQVREYLAQRKGAAA